MSISNSVKLFLVIAAFLTWHSNAPFSEAFNCSRTDNYCQLEATNFFGQKETVYRIKLSSIQTVNYECTTIRRAIGSENYSVCRTYIGNANDSKAHTLFVVSEASPQRAEKLRSYLYSKDERVAFTQYNLVLITMFLGLLFLAVITHNNKLDSWLSDKFKQIKQGAIGNIIYFGGFFIVMIPIVVIFLLTVRKSNVPPKTTNISVVQTTPIPQSSYVPEPVTPEKQQALLSYEKELFCDSVKPCDNAMSVHLILNGGAQDAVLNCAQSYETIIQLHEPNVLSPENRKRLNAIRSRYEKIIDANLIDANRFLDGDLQAVTSYVPTASQYDIHDGMDSMKQINDSFGVSDKVYREISNSKLSNINCDILNKY